MTAAVYRFLPFTRRGLAAELRDSAGAADGPLPARAAVHLDVTLADGMGGASTTTAVAGPGDVVGLDPRAIVRTTPRRDATGVEPNYLAAVDFDDPDLPWLLTPAAANAQGRLRPWLALVVVEARPGVDIAVPAGAPLPQLRIAHGAAAELGDLTGSWAWAHTQLLVAEGSGLQAAGAMQSDPDRHVSRLLCPRRLRPGARWFACLVPAFDAGVQRGLGRTPDPAAPLGPAWSGADQVTLPLYFHWEFSTGPDGDFESLARRLQPFKVGESADGTPTVGTVELHIGAAGGPVDLPEGHPQRIVEMDGALRALAQRDGRLDEIPTAFTRPLAELLDAIADPSGSDPDDGAVGPPLYGAWAANRFRVGASPDGWFRELNLDPRTRTAAGLGAETVRREQEDLMTACWEQVGSVREANALLSRAELSIQSSTRLHARTIARMAPERALTFAAPLASRAAMAGATVRAAIAPTSLPDTVVDPALRRLVAPTGRFVRKATADRPAAAAVGGRFVARLAAGALAVDPTDFVPTGVEPPSATPPPAPPPPAERLRLRADLRSVGLVTARHIALVREHADVFVAADRTADPILRLREVAATRPAPGSGFVIGRRIGGGLGIEFVDRVIGGDLVVRTGPTRANEVVVRVQGRLAEGQLERNLRLPPGAIRPGEPPLVVRPDAGGVVPDRPPIVRRPIDPAPVVRPPLRPPVGPPLDPPIVRPPVVRPPVRPPVDPPPFDPPPVVRPPIDRPPVVRPDLFEGQTMTVPPLVRDALVLNRFEEAIGRIAEVAALADAPPARQLVPFALDAAAGALAARCHPERAHRARVGSMVRFGAVTLTDLHADGRRDGLALAPQFDRIMAYPELALPAYRLLADYDRTRLLPGVDAIPPDSVTLLETNPRFVAAFLAGFNHEFGRELLWRRYPTDQRGTPVRRFWDRLGATDATDVPPMHQWPLDRSLAAVAGGEANLVLLVRGELMRRYPNTVVLAVPAVTPVGAPGGGPAGGLAAPSTDESRYRRAIFAGFLEPDITFFGFDLVDDDLRRGDGWFFALQEQITEPRFGLDERAAGPAPSAWRDAAWPHTAIAPGAPFTVDDLRRFADERALRPAPTTSAAVAEALFQNPVQVMVHARHLAFVEEAP